jgi:Uma2 family endonuclease
MIAHALHRRAEEGHIMGMPAPQAITTIDGLLGLPDDGMRHELLDGEHVVTPAPSVVHQRVLGRLWNALSPVVATGEGVELFWSPADIHLGPHTLVQPDLFIVRLPVGISSLTWKDVPVPLLAIEALSPSTAARDRGKKRRLYLDAGVEEYWIVDIDAQLVERWRAGDERPEIVHDELRWELSVGVAGVVDVAKVFARV